jgi:hypothetical protein
MFYLILIFVPLFIFRFFSKAVYQQTVVALPVAVPALANAGPDYDPCGGPLKIIVQSKKKGLRTKNQNGPFLSFVFTFSQETSQTYYLFTCPHERGASISTGPDCVSSVQWA